MREQANTAAAVAAVLAAAHGMKEAGQIIGRYHFELREFEGGPIIREWDDDNVVCTEGKNLMLNAALTGAPYTVTGPYLGLISSTSFSSVQAADTMASHAGWLEAGAANTPPWSTPASGARGATAWSGATGGAKALSAAISFTFSGSGTVQGAFMTYGTGAVATNGSTAGVLLSASAFGTPQPVISGNVLAVSYSIGL